MAEFQRKFLSTTTTTTGLGERQVRVVASTPGIDRAGDVVVAEGIDLAAYKGNPVILWNHDPGSPIARCIDIGVVDGQLEAVAQFPPEGTDALADRVYGLIKAGVVNATSIGFNPVEETPLKGGGVTVKRSELWEFSFVSVPANPDALVVERSLHAATAVPRLKVKGLYSVSWLAGLLADLGYLEDGVAFEAELEGDGSPVPEMLATAMRQLGEALVAMTAEEVAELLADESTKAAHTVRRKTMTAIVKAGRVLSSANEDALTQARDLIIGVLAQLEPDAPEDEAEPEDQPDEIQKSAPEPQPDEVQPAAAPVDASDIEIRRRRAILARLKSAA